MTSKALGKLLVELVPTRNVVYEDNSRKGSLHLGSCYVRMNFITFTTGISRDPSIDASATPGVEGVPHNQLPSFVFSKAYQSSVEVFQPTTRPIQSLQNCRCSCLRQFGTGRQTQQSRV